jgi:hypothetical protein
MDRRSSGLARLSGDAIFLPGPTQCIALDRKTGQPRESYPLDATRGLLVTDRALFVLTDRGLQRLER